jgi:hypothetical protein
MATAEGTVSLAEKYALPVSHDMLIGLVCNCRTRAPGPTLRKEHVAV